MKKICLLILLLPILTLAQNRPGVQVKTNQDFYHNKMVSMEGHFALYDTSLWFVYNAGADSMRLFVRNDSLIMDPLLPTNFGGSGGSGSVTSVATSNGITGGPITTTGTISGVNAAADGSTKGVSAYTANDFNASSGVISIDYTNTQKASGSQPGALSSTDWNTFNDKVSSPWVEETNGIHYTTAGSPTGVASVGIRNDTVEMKINNSYLNMNTLGSESARLELFIDGSPDGFANIAMELNPEETSTFSHSQGGDNSGWTMSAGQYSLQSTGVISINSDDSLHVQTEGYVAFYEDSTRFKSLEGSGNRFLKADAQGTLNPGSTTVSLSSEVSGDLPFANLTQIAGLSLLGVAGSSTADVAAITAANDNELFRRSGSTIGFGTVNLSNGATIFTGQLPVTRGGTGTNFSSIAVGDILYSASTNSWNGNLPSVSAGSFLRSGGVTTAPAWSTTKWTNSATTGDVIYASASNTYSNLTAVATGNALISGGVTTAPSWGKIGLTTHVSGILPIANGGTGSNMGTLAVGDLFYASSTTGMSRLVEPSTANSMLLSGGSGTAPSWSITKWPTSSSGGELIYSQSANNYQNLADVATGNVLLSGGVGSAPSYGKVGLTTHVSGTLDVGNGGTGATNPTDALTNLLPDQSGNAGNVLTTDGTNTSWAPANTTCETIIWLTQTGTSAPTVDNQHTTGACDLTVNSTTYIDVGKYEVHLNSTLDRASVAIVVQNGIHHSAPVPYSTYASLCDGTCEIIEVQTAIADGGGNTFSDDLLQQTVIIVRYYP